MLHVCAHEMAGRERGAEGELAREHAGGDDARELPSVGARRRLVRATHAQEVEHGSLRRQEGPATNRADFDAGHADADLEVAVQTERGVSDEDASA